MDLSKSYEKQEPVCFNQHNIFNDPDKTQYEIPKTENTQWSITNEQLRVSSTSEHYATINDERNDVIAAKNYGDDESGKFESIANSYMSFSTWEPPLVKNERTPGYSYATNKEINFSQIDDLGVEQGATSTFSSNVPGTFSYQSPESKYRHYDNAKHKQTVQLSQNQSEVSNNNSLQEPLHVLRARKYDLRPPVPKVELGESLNSVYCEGRVNAGNKVQLPSNKNDKRKCNKCRVISCALLGLLVVTVAAAVAVVFILQKIKDDDVCVNKQECVTNCQNYKNISNGHTNVTEEVPESTVVQITCYPGYQVVGKDTAICLETGIWSRDITCVPIDCGKYQPPSHVNILQPEHKTPFGTLVNVTCDSGFQFTSDSDTYVVCNEKGEWVGDPKCENLVDISIDSDNIVIGETASLSCEFRKIPGWRNIHFNRISSSNVSVPIASIKNNVDSYELSKYSDEIVILEKTFTHESGKFRLMFDTIQCTDAFEEPGEIKMECGVEIGDSVNTYRDIHIVRIQGKAVKPELYISPHVIEGEDTPYVFHCEMLFPEPNGHLLIEADLDGSFKTLLSSLNGEYETDNAWVEDIKFKLENCWYRMVVEFGLKQVSMKWHRKHIRCTAKPSNDAFDQAVFTSESGVVKVIQDNMCSGIVTAPFPYDCQHFITCDDTDNYNSVLEVRACDKNQCYDQTISRCSTCLSADECPVTDIYFYGGKSNIIGGQLDIFCVVENIQGLTDIKITRANGEFVSSIKLGDNIAGINTIPDMTYLNGTNGMLSLNFEYLVCTDKSTYRCLPEGKETSKLDDVIDLDINCA